MGQTKLKIRGGGEVIGSLSSIRDSAEVFSLIKSGKEKGRMAPTVLEFSSGARNRTPLPIFHDFQSAFSPTICNVSINKQNSYLFVS